MNIAIIELLFIGLLLLGIGAYVKGRKYHIPMLISLGRRSSIILGIMFIVYNLISIKKYM